MNEQNGENLEELFERFVDAEQAERAAEDVRKGEQIFGEYCAPEPDEKLIADIKLRIAGTLPRKRALVFKRIAYRAAAVAAAVIILTVLNVRLFEKDVDVPERAATASIWEGDETAVGDADLAILTAELEEIESEVIALQLGENGENGDSPISEFEIELTEINGDFWKG